MVDRLIAYIKFYDYRDYQTYGVMVNTSYTLEEVLSYIGELKRNEQIRSFTFWGITD